MKRRWIVGVGSLLAVGVIAGVIHSPSDERPVAEATSLSPLQSSEPKEPEEVLPNQTGPTFYSLGDHNTFSYHLELMHSTEFLAPGDLVDVHVLGPINEVHDIWSDVQRVQISRVSSTGVELILTMNELRYLTFFEGRSFRFMLAKRHFYDEELSCHDLKWTAPYDPHVTCGTTDPHQYERESKNVKKHRYVTLDVPNVSKFLEERQAVFQVKPDKTRTGLSSLAEVFFIPSPNRFKANTLRAGSNIMKISDSLGSRVGVGAVELRVKANDLNYLRLTLQLGELRTIAPLDGFSDLETFNPYDNIEHIIFNDSDEELSAFLKSHPTNIFKERNEALKMSMGCKEVE